MQHALFSVILAVAACTGPNANSGLTGIEMDCEFTGDGSEDSICATFRAALGDTDRPDLSRIEIAALTPTSARATAFDKQGEVIAWLDFEVMDAEMTSAKWRLFAEDFARHLASQD